jgi:hypothetical protein
MSIIKSILNAVIPSNAVNYEFVERKVEGDETGLVQVATRITYGKYEGLIFSTGPVTFEENGPEIKLNYKFIVEFLPENMELASDLDNVVGDIIMDVLSKEHTED